MNRLVCLGFNDQIPDGMVMLVLKGCFVGYGPFAKVPNDAVFDKAIVSPTDYRFLINRMINKYPAEPGRYLH